MSEHGGDQGSHSHSILSPSSERVALRDVMEYYFSESNHGAQDHEMSGQYDGTSERPDETSAYRSVSHAETPAPYPDSENEATYLDFVSWVNARSYGRTITPRMTLWNDGDPRYPRDQHRVAQQPRSRATTPGPFHYPSDYDGNGRESEDDEPMGDIGQSSPRAESSKHECGVPLPQSGDEYVPELSSRSVSSGEEGGVPLPQSDDEYEAELRARMPPGINPWRYAADQPSPPPAHPEGYYYESSVGSVTQRSSVEPPASVTRRRLTYRETSPAGIMTTEPDSPESVTHSGYVAGSESSSLTSRVAGGVDLFQPSSLADSPGRSNDDFDALSRDEAQDAHLSLLTAHYGDRLLNADVPSDYAGVPVDTPSDFDENNVTYFTAPSPPTTRPESTRQSDNISPEGALSPAARIPSGQSPTPIDPGPSAHTGEASSTDPPPSGTSAITDSDVHPFDYNQPGIGRQLPDAWAGNSDPRDFDPPSSDTDSLPLPFANLARIPRHARCTHGPDPVPTNWRQDPPCPLNQGAGAGVLVNVAGYTGPRVIALDIGRRGPAGQPHADWTTDDHVSGYTGPVEVRLTTGGLGLGEMSVAYRFFTPVRGSERFSPSRMVNEVVYPRGRDADSG